MRFHDLRDFDDDQLIEADICIIGSGPAGLSMAGEFANTDVKVWVIESGGHEVEPATQKLYNYENIGVPRCISQDLIRIRRYGGTSALWTGRVAPFDEIDFRKRDWIDYSGWPVSKNELEPYFERAGDILGLGPNRYDDRLWKHFNTAKPEPDLSRENLKSEFWQFSKSRTVDGEPTRFATDFDPPNSDNINILLHANLTQINMTDGDSRGNGTEEADSVESVSISTLEGMKALIRAKTVILSCGGVENARLLLASNRQHPSGLGNQHDMVGRFFMDHPYCELGEFSFKQCRKLLNRFSHFWLDNEKGRNVYLHGLSLSREVQEKEQLLNCAVYLVTGKEIDASWLTAKRLLMSIKGGKFNIDLIKDFFRVIFQLDKVIDGFFRRYVKNRPPIMESNRVALGCNVEQLPDPDSRITLSERRDVLGMPMVRIDWQISEKERQTVIRMAELINQELPAIGLPPLDVVKWLKNSENRKDDIGWKANFFDNAHHMGSTRMSADPMEGVVDANCKVHGINGLYIAGSSVFPTAGTANPMVMIVSLALRLADHLKS